MKIKHDSHTKLLAYIEKADIAQLNQVMDAVKLRYRTAFPEWQVVYAAAHRDADKRKHDIDSIIDLLYRT